MVDQRVDDWLVYCVRRVCSMLRCGQDSGAQWSNTVVPAGLANQQNTMFRGFRDTSLVIYSYIALEKRGGQNSSPTLAKFLVCMLPQITATISVRTLQNFREEQIAHPRISISNFSCF
jgi:hypothetical protein